MERHWIGLGAGLLGGFAGSIAIGQFLQIWSKATGRKNNLVEGQRSTTKAASAVAENVLHRQLTRAEKPKAGNLVHFTFGTAMGALYGVAKAIAPRTPTACGALFGAGVYLGAHASAVPALGLGESIRQKPLIDEAGEFFGHIVYGLVTDLTHRGILAAAGE